MTCSLRPNTRTHRGQKRWSAGRFRHYRSDEGVAGISFTHFSSKDVVRRPLVQKIVDAYAGYQEPEDKSDRDAS